MYFSAKSDKGKVRVENQDAYSVGRLSNGIYAVVCDGMGGAAGGSIASAAASNAFSSAMTTSYNPSASKKSLKSMLTVFADKANAAVHKIADERPELKGMGTTLVAAVMNEDKLSVIHAGDSRAYLYQYGELTQLTKDHSMVQALVDDGYISEEQAEHHMYKNIITRALGTEAQIKVDFSEYPIESSDIVLLCTDGLTNYVSKTEMINILENQDLDDAAQKLIDTANLNGGGDNITVVLMKKD